MLVVCVRMCVRVDVCVCMRVDTCVCVSLSVCEKTEKVLKRSAVEIHALSLLSTVLLHQLLLLLRQNSHLHPRRPKQRDST